MWTEDLKAGDIVIVSKPEFDRLYKVDRVTKTLVIVGSFRFRKSDGYLAGVSTWNRVYLTEPTPEKLKEVKRQMNIARIKSLVREANFDHVSAESLEAVINLLR